MKINKIGHRASYLNFKASMPENFYKYTEKKTIQLEQKGRILTNKLSDFLINISLKYTTLKNKLLNKNLPDPIDINLIQNLKEGSLAHTLFGYNISRLLTKGKEVEINIENNELQNITDSNESCIFIMNHDKQKEDAKMLNFFNALLLREYLYKDKGENHPISKIILNKDIIETAGEKKQLMAEKWGAVGVDAAIHCTNHIYNGKVTSKLVNELAEDKINLFIFPEGRMCAFSTLDPQYKFQPGVADIIKAVAKKKNRVKVVPLGFAYKNKVGSIHIGEPLYFKKEGNNVLFTPGTIDKRFTDPKLVEFLDTTPAINEEYRIITDNNTPVDIKKSREYIAGILCENLTACKKLAAESIENVGTEKDVDTVYSIEEKWDGN